MLLRYFLVVLFIAIHNLHGAVDVVIFSYNRPLQLYALLESLEKYVSGLGKVTVLYRVGSPAYSKAYEEVKKRFELIHFMEQPHYNAPQTFKALTIQACNCGESEFITFAVDDIIVKDFCDFAYCEQLLKKKNAYAFFLRLGKNITKSYPNIEQNIPNLISLEQDIYYWQFKGAAIAWSYVYNLDMTIYRKADIMPLILQAGFTAPNPLEGELSVFRYQMGEEHGLCFAQSKIVNIPMNQVQTCCPIPNMQISPRELLEVFNRGLKINIDDMHCINNCAPHMDLYPTFIER